MVLGNQSFHATRAVESQKSTALLRTIGRRRQSSYGSNSYGISFAMSEASNLIMLSDFIAKIPFQQIGEAVGVCVSIYFYGKIIIVVQI